MPEFTAEFWSICWLSLRVSGMAVLLAALLGIPLGIGLGLANFRGRRLLGALINTGMAVPPVVLGLALYLLLSRSGPLGFLGWLFTPTAMITAQTILALPFVIGITSTALASVPAELSGQLRSLGASPWQCRWTMLREARRGVLLAVSAAFGRSLSEVGAVWLVGGNIQWQTRVFTTAIVMETNKGQFGLALALGAALLSLALTINLLMWRWQGHEVRL